MCEKIARRLFPAKKVSNHAFVGATFHSLSFLAFRISAFLSSTFMFITDLGLPSGLRMAGFRIMWYKIIVIN